MSVLNIIEINMFTAILILLTVFLGILLLWKRENRFEKLGIAHVSPLPILGNMASVVFQRTSMSEYLEATYKQFSDRTYCGIYNFITPVIMIRDPELITSIAIKNFDYFTDHRGFVNADLDPLMGKNLFALKGDHWREMRKLLSPAFTSAKLKAMFNLIIECADTFTEHVAMESKAGKIYNLKDIFGRYTTDVIATTSFGISVNSMKNRENEFFVFAKETMNLGTIVSLKMMIGMNFPNLSRLLGIRIFSEKARRYFTNVVTETVQMRKEKGIYRPDMIQLMMESRDTNGRELTIDEMTNQAFVFFLAGYDTSSNVMCFIAHEIAANPDVQAKLLAEIEDVFKKTNGKPTYEAIKNMAYMEAVFNETNRLYPVAVFLDRVCIKEFELPPATPDSKPVLMKPGDNVWIAPIGLHRDPKYFPEPLKFDPDRFLNNDIPQNIFVPFGLGPRVCIGNRFALMEAKILFFYLLLRCRIEPCAKTTLPMKFTRKTIPLAAKNGFWLNFKPRVYGSESRANGALDKTSNGTSLIT